MFASKFGGRLVEPTLTGWFAFAKAKYLFVEISFMAGLVLWCLTWCSVLQIKQEAACIGGRMRWADANTFSVYHAVGGEVGLTRLFLIIYWRQSVHFDMRNFWLGGFVASVFCLAFFCL